MATIEDLGAAAIGSWPFSVLRVGEI